MDAPAIGRRRRPGDKLRAVVQIDVTMHVGAEIQGIGDLAISGLGTPELVKGFGLSYLVRTDSIYE